MVLLNTPIGKKNNFVSEVAPDTSTKTIFITSAYRDKIKSDSTAAADMESVDSQRLTSETRRNAITNDSIFANLENVNTKFHHSLIDLINQETTELYDRLSEAVEDHYAAERAVGTERDPAANCENNYNNI